MDNYFKRGGCALSIGTHFSDTAHPPVYNKGVGSRQICCGPVSLFDYKLQCCTRKDTPIGYRNAADVLPEEILNLIRHYVEGEAIYIPKADKRTKWGGNSGLRNEYDIRNMRIAEERKNGASVAELSERYCLCEDSIRKILKKSKR